MLTPSKIYAVKTRHPHSFDASGSIAGQRSRQKYEKKYAKWKLCVAIFATRAGRRKPGRRKHGLTAGPIAPQADPPASAPIGTS